MGEVIYGKVGRQLVNFDYAKPRPRHIKVTKAAELVMLAYFGGAVTVWMIQAVTSWVK